MQMFFSMTLLSAVIAVSCSGSEGERAEQIDKLRAIGVRSEPAVSTFIVGQESVSGTKTFEFLLLQPSPASLPSVETLEFNASERPFSQVALQVLEEPTVDELGPIRLIRQRATAEYQIPPQYLQQAAKSMFLNLSYGLGFRSGGDVEKVSGQTVFLNSELLPQSSEWQEPSIQILEPTDYQALSGNEVNLLASLTPKAVEMYKIAWYCSGGKTGNRRSLQTTWKEIPSGRQVAIVTARGRTTGMLSFAKVVVEIP